MAARTVIHANARAYSFVFHLWRTCLLTATYVLFTSHGGLGIHQYRNPDITRLSFTLPVPATLFEGSWSIGRLRRDVCIDGRLCITAERAFWGYKPCHLQLILHPVLWSRGIGCEALTAWSLFQSLVFDNVYIFVSGLSRYIFISVTFLESAFKFFQVWLLKYEIQSAARYV